MENSYKVADIMVKDVQTTTPGETVLTCAKTMAEKRVGCLVVLEEEKVVGILTEQDLARKVVAGGLNPETTKVSEIMSSSVETTEPERDLRTATDLMGKTEVKHLPVVAEGKLLGIITAKDIVRIQPSLIELLTFKHSQQQ